MKETEQTTDRLHRDIMSYEPDIWAIADDLIAVSIKQSDFPTYMMPFFALMMLEGRMRNAVMSIKEEEGLSPEDGEDFRDAFLEKGCGYNDYIVMQGKTLGKIVMNDSTFEQDFGHYVNGFDEDLKRLLGIDRGQEEKFLNLDAIVANLRSKGILLTVTKKWAAIDLAPYSNSEITTLEEHIKRKWADISASTAGEQYTPADIIALISEIVASKISKPKEDFIHVYDPTCGGANLLFGVAERLSKENGYRHVATYGSEYNDALYALAAIESRFRTDSQISYGNTLTKIPFKDVPFDVIVANPPYGTKWDGYKNDIVNDQTGQFVGGLPAISDGQLLFMQHILWQLADDGIAVEVHNGSTLFSGDAGSGESDIRKFVFDNDWVEAIIQMPQNEFFNTGIFTYLWVMNKRKPAERRGRVALIDGSKGWSLLKKSKGDKRREMLPEHRQAIVDALYRFESTDICKVYDREYFYYNKQSLTLYETDVCGLHVAQNVCTKGKPFTIKGTKALTVGDEHFDDIAELSSEEIGRLGQRMLLEWSDLYVSVVTAGGESYEYDPESRCIDHKKADGKLNSLGCGKFGFKSSKSKKMGLTYNVTIAPCSERDYEIIPHRFDEDANREEIEGFLSRYVIKSYVLGDNVVGVEINFNKEFFVPERMDSVEDILSEIRELEKEMGGIGV